MMALGICARSHLPGDAVPTAPCEGGHGDPQHPPHPAGTLDKRLPTCFTGFCRHSPHPITGQGAGRSFPGHTRQPVSLAEGMLRGLLSTGSCRALSCNTHAPANSPGLTLGKYLKNRHKLFTVVVFFLFPCLTQFECTVTPETVTVLMFLCQTLQVSSMKDLSR